jgi:hypothetical protein
VVSIWVTAISYAKVLRQDSARDRSKQARTLRLLATCYAASHNTESALSCLRTAAEVMLRLFIGRDTRSEAILTSRRV